MSDEFVFKPLSYKDLQDIPPETREQAYRRGYRDGFIAALYGACKRGIPNKLWMFWQDTLFKWQMTDTEKFVIPPEIK